VGRDELIDNVARRMTAVEGRSGMRARVLAGLGAAPSHTSPGWLAPAAACATIAVVALAWVLVPSPRITERAPVVAQEQPMPAAAPAVAAPATTEVARAAPTRLPSRRDLSAPVTGMTTWAETPMAEIPTLPPLAGPPPIVIEPIAWREVTIAPLEVELIEVKALEIEPLVSADHSGV
jgi:hypothetical protein